MDQSGLPMYSKYKTPLQTAVKFLQESGCSSLIKNDALLSTEDKCVTMPWDIYISKPCEKLKKHRPNSDEEKYMYATEKYKKAQRYASACIICDGSHFPETMQIGGAFHVYEKKLDWEDEWSEEPTVTKSV